MEKVEVTSMSSKGQVVIPLDVRKRLGLKEGEKFAVLAEGDTVLLKKISMPSSGDFKVLREETESYVAEKKNRPKGVKDAIKRSDSLFSKAGKLLKSYGAKKAYVFGSYARGEQKEGSDLDLIVEFSGSKSLLDMVEIEDELSEYLGVKVDLLSEEAISPYIMPYVLKERKVILP
jgi:AbrB family looped-hinge helix DNA binding protein